MLLVLVYGVFLVLVGITAGFTTGQIHVIDGGWTAW